MINVSSEEGEMGEWVSVNDRLPDEGCEVLVTDGKIVRVSQAKPGPFFSVSWYGTIGTPTHWRHLPPPPESKLTVKEALREAIGVIQDCWGYALQLKCEKEDFGRLIDLTNELNEIDFKGFTTRLRAALESEE